MMFEFYPCVRYFEICIVFYKFAIQEQGLIYFLHC